MLNFGILASSGLAAGGGLPVSGSNLWLDASDASTITSSAGKVSQWDDKSGTGNHAVQATEARKLLTGTRTQNGLNVIECPATGFMSVSGTEGDLPKTVFVVFLTDNVSAQYRGIIGSQGAAADNGGWRVLQTKTSGTMGASVYTGGAPHAESFTSPSLNTPYLHHSKLVTSGYIDSALNNDSYSTSANAVNGFVNSDRGYFISNVNGSNFYHDGWIGEIVTFPSILGASDIATMKTYFNDKWNLW